jgi:hypothetical protein
VIDPASAVQSCAAVATIVSNTGWISKLDPLIP